MKLLVLHDKVRGDLGGMANFIAAQNTLFRQEGWTVSEVIADAAPQADALQIAPSGRRLGLQAHATLKALIRDHQPDVLLAHSVYYALGPWALQALQKDIPFIYFLHDVTPLCPKQTRLHRSGTICQKTQGLGCLTSGCYQPWQGRLASNTYGLLMRSLQSRAAHAVTQWIVPSQYLADLLVQHSIPSQRVAVVPHFVQPLLPTHSAPETLPSSARNRLLFVGRLVPEKGAQCLLDALAQMAHPIDWQLHIAGVGPELAALERTVALRGWQERVTFCGALSATQLRAEYAAATAVVMPSLIPESFGLVGIEAMQHGKPVVGFASGGMREWLRDGVTGKVARWGDAASLAAALTEVLTSPAQARQWGEQGRAMVQAEFHPHAHMRHMRALLQRMTQHAR